MTSLLDDTLELRIRQRQEKNLWRRQRIVSRKELQKVFCSNDYLGLASTNALADTVEDPHYGAAASRLVSGTTVAHYQLEQALADWMDVEACRYFPTGYQANIGLLSSLITREDIVFSDALNHASLIDGIRLSRAKTVVFEHADMEDLRSKLEAHSSHQGNRWIISDAIFSMDGDRCRVTDLVELAEEFAAHLYIDEAHGLGVIGDKGRGLVHSLGQADKVDVLVGTCGKSMGASGAFVAGSHILCDYIYNAARSFVFSTAPSPAVCDAVRHAIRWLEGGEKQRQLWKNIERFASHLRELGWWRGAAQSPIFPIVLGAEADAVAMSQALDSRGFFVHPIRPPTVPRGTSRLRITICAHHQPEMIDQLAEALKVSSDTHSCTPGVWSHG